MAADCVSPLNSERDAFRASLVDFLRKYSFECAIERDILDTTAELVLASGITISKLKLRKREFIGIETALPTMGYVDVIPKTHLGISGALLMVESVLNGLVF